MYCQFLSLLNPLCYIFSHICFFNNKVFNTVHLQRQNNELLDCGGLMVSPPIKPFFFLQSAVNLPLRSNVKIFMKFCSQIVCHYMMYNLQLNKKNTTKLHSVNFRLPFQKQKEDKCIREIKIKKLCNLCIFQETICKTITCWFYTSFSPANKEKYGVFSRKTKF